MDRVMLMDRGDAVEPVMIVATALIAGAAAGASEVMSSAVRDLYIGFKSLVLDRFRSGDVGDTEGELLIAQALYQEQGKEALIRELTRVQVDDTTLDAAEALLRLLDSQGKRTFHVEVRDSTGVVVGDNNMQTINIHPR